MYVCVCVSAYLWSLIWMITMFSYSKMNYNETSNNNDYKIWRIKPDVLSWKDIARQFKTDINTLDIQ